MATIEDRADEVRSAALNQLEGAYQDGAESREEEIRELSNLVADISEDLRVARAEALDWRRRYEATKRRVLFGACPATRNSASGKNAAAAMSVIDKFGTGAFVRQFLDATTVAPRVSEASQMHFSWANVTSATITEDWVARVCAQLKAGDYVEIIHEADKKVRDGRFSFAEAVAMKNKFFDVVEKVRPDLWVVSTYTGWLFEPRSKLDVDQWAQAKAHVVGLDADGIVPSSSLYIDFVAETERVRQFLSDFGDGKLFRAYSVPEFGASRHASDPSGTARANWHDYYAELWGSDPLCDYVALYDYNTTMSPQYELTTSAELDGWRRHVSGGVK